MAKFHINTDTGEAGACKATKGNCPFGDDSVHFTSAEAARASYENFMNTSSTIAPEEIKHEDLISLINDKTGARILDEDVNFTGYNNLIRVPSGSPTNSVDQLVNDYGWRIYKRTPATEQTLKAG